jgi:hypothetical protein
MTVAERVDPLEETAAWLSDVAHDPVAFVEGAFAWGEGELANFDGPMEWQRWVLTQIRDGLLTSRKSLRGHRRVHTSTVPMTSMPWRSVRRRARPRGPRVATDGRRPRKRWLTRGDFNVRFLEYHWTSITVNGRT